MLVPVYLVTAVACLVTMALASSVGDRSPASDAAVASPGASSPTAPLGRAPASSSKDGLLRLLEGQARAMVAAMESAHPDDERTRRLTAWLAATGGRLREVPRDKKNRPGYTTSKRDIHVCVDDETGGPMDPVDATFVLLHEMTHVATSEMHHTPAFWNNFRFVLTVAQGAGIIEVPDYDHAPRTYCGYRISSSAMLCLRNGTCQLK